MIPVEGIEWVNQTRDFWASRLTELGYNSIGFFVDWSNFRAHGIFGRKWK